MKLVIGLPVFNEEANIENIIKNVKRFSSDIIVCDDGSTDNSIQILKNLDITIVKHEKNLGYGEAIRSIFSKFLETEGDILVTIDSDGQHEVKDIPKLIEPIEQGQADLVIGSRFLEDKNQIPKYRKFGINTITKITNIGTKQNITDSQSGFRAYSRNVLSEISLREKGMSISTEILLKADRKNFKIKEVGTKILYLQNSSTHNPVSHGISVMMKTMKFVSIDHPLLFYGVPGLIFLIIGLIFIVWTIQIYTESNQVITNIALIGLSSIIISVLLLITALLLFSIISVIREK